MSSSDEDEADPVIVPISIEADDVIRIRSVLLRLAQVREETAILVSHSKERLKTIDDCDIDQARMTLSNAYLLWLGGLLVRGLLASDSAKVAIRCEDLR